MSAVSDSEDDTPGESILIGRAGPCVECRRPLSDRYVECGQERLYGPLCQRHAEVEIQLQAGDDES